MTLPAGYSKVRLTHIDAVLNVQNEIVGFLDDDGTMSAIPMFSRTADGTVTDLIGPDGNPVGIALKGSTSVVDGFIATVEINHASGSLDLSAMVVRMLPLIVSGPVTIPITGSLVGASGFGLVIADGANTPTVSGATEWGNSAGYLNTAGVPNRLDAWHDGLSLRYSWSQEMTPTVAAIPIAPVVVTAPGVAGAAVGVGVTWSAAVVTGIPTPTVTYDVLIGGAVVASGATSGSYTPSVSGAELTVMATATNASGTATGTSAPVTVAAAPTVPAQVTGLTLGTATSTTQPLTWTAPGNGGSAITDYTIQWSPAGANTWTSFTHSASTTAAITVTGLTASTNYDFRVAAVNAIGAGAYSATSTGATPAPAIINIRASAAVGTTESGDATAGWTYTGNASDVGFAGNPAFVSDKKIPANSDGYFDVKLTSWTSGTAGLLVGLTTTQANGAYTSTVQSIYVPGSASPNYLGSTGGTGGQNLTVSRATVNNDIMRIGRSGSNIYLAVSSDGGTTFTTLRTAAAGTTAALYLQVIWGTSGVKASTIHGFGVV
jgi:hypothetical protein